MATQKKKRKVAPSKAATIITDLCIDMVDVASKKVRCEREEALYLLIYSLASGLMTLTDAKNMKACLRGTAKLLTEEDK